MKTEDVEGYQKEDQENPCTPTGNDDKTWPQVMVICIVTLCGITNGLLFSWTSPFFVKITQDKLNYDISEEQGSQFNTISAIAMMVVAPFCSKLPDLIGRKKTILLSSIPQICSWLCSGFSSSVYFLYTARVFAGICDALFFASVPIYIGEISNPTVRGTWGNLVSSSYYLGEFLINVLGSYLSAHQTAYLCLPIPVIFVVLFCMMPESPYYYLIKNQDDNARTSLMFLKRSNDVEESFIQLKADTRRQMSESATWKDLLYIKSNRKAILAGGFLRITQQLSGIFVFLTYTQFIFQKSGGNLSHEVSAMIYLGLHITLNILVLIFVVSRFGRRSCLLTSFCPCTVILLIMASFYYIEDNTKIDVSNYNWFPIGSMVIFQIFASFGISVMPTLMLSELFSASIKTKAMVVMLFSFGIGIFIASNLFYLINNLFGFYATFLMYSACNAIGAIGSYYIIPETKGKTLEEIQQALKGNKMS